MSGLHNRERVKTGRKSGYRKIAYQTQPKTPVISIPPCRNVDIQPYAGAYALPETEHRARFAARDAHLPTAPSRGTFLQPAMPSHRPAGVLQERCRSATLAQGRSGSFGCVSPTAAAIAIPGATWGAGGYVWLNSNSRSSLGRLLCDAVRAIFQNSHSEARSKRSTRFEANSTRVSDLARGDSRSAARSFQLFAGLHSKIFLELLQKFPWARVSRSHASSRSPSAVRRMPGADPFGALVGADAFERCFWAARALTRAWYLRATPGGCPTAATSAWAALSR